MTLTEMESIVEDTVDDLEEFLRDEGVRLPPKHKVDIYNYMLDRLLPLAKN